MPRSSSPGGARLRVPNLHKGRVRWPRVPHRHRLWIDTVAERLGLSPWSAVVALGILSYALFLVCYVAAGASPDLLDIVLYGLGYFVPVAFAALAASVYVRDKMVALEAHAISMVEDPKAATEVIAPISSLRGIGIMASAVFVIFVVPYLISSTPSQTVVFDRTALILATIPWLPVVWFIATAWWTLAYSLVGVYRIGKLPMKLRPFTIDRRLGLKPFAATCLRLTAIYYGLVSFTILTDLDSPLPSQAVVVRTLGFATLGLLLFLLPLWSLHEKLMRAKAEKIVWINDRYDRIVRKIESGADGPLEAGIQGELLGIDKIQRDIQSIRTWPFDMNSLAKLITILLSVTAILLARFIAPFLGI